MAKYKYKSLIAIALTLLFATGASAGDYPVLKTDRYTEIELAPSAGQMEPLTAVVQLKFPGNVITVEDAVNYLLDESGYKIVAPEYREEAMNIMLKNSLPVVQRDFTESPMSILSALEMLAGSAFDVVQDPLRRLVSFELKSEYKGFIDG